MPRFCRIILLATLRTLQYFRREPANHVRYTRCAATSQAIIGGLPYWRSVEAVAQAKFIGGF
jgi:hypothetical protein